MSDHWFQCLVRIAGWGNSIARCQWPQFPSSIPPPGQPFGRQYSGRNAL